MTEKFTIRPDGSRQWNPDYQRTQAEDFLFSWESLQQDRGLMGPDWYEVIANYLLHLSDNFLKRNYDEWGDNYPELRKYVEEYRKKFPVKGPLLVGTTGLIHIDRTCQFGPAPERKPGEFKLKTEVNITAIKDEDVEAIVAAVERAIKTVRFR